MLDGRKLVTLRDAAEYVLALPPEVRAEPAWQGAAKELKNAAELDPAWRWFARSAIVRALHGPDDPPVGNPEGKKGHSWRTSARDR